MKISSKCFRKCLTLTKIELALKLIKKVCMQSTRTEKMRISFSRSGVQN